MLDTLSEALQPIEWLSEDWAKTMKGISKACTEKGRDSLACNMVRAPSVTVDQSWVRLEAWVHSEYEKRTYYLANATFYKNQEEWTTHCCCKVRYEPFLDALNAQFLISHF